MTVANYPACSLATSGALQAREPLDPFHSMIFTNGTAIVCSKDQWVESFAFILREHLTPCYAVGGDTRPVNKHAMVNNTRLPRMSRTDLIPARNMSTPVSNVPQEQQIDKSEQNSTNRSGPPGV